MRLSLLRTLLFCSLGSMTAVPALHAQMPVAPLNDSTKPLGALEGQAAPAWLNSAVIYEIFPRSFSPTGDLNGVTRKLDDLQKLGVNVLWLMPLHPVGQIKKKGTDGSPYALQDYYVINPSYGTKDDLHHLTMKPIAGR